jgi:hypothetical protein
MEVFMVEKRVLVADRVRRPPSQGFSWIDRRFLRDHAQVLSRDAVLLYFFFAAASDKNGLSFWSDEATAVRLKLDIAAVYKARDELIRRDLVAFAAPLTQVLALPEPPRGGQPGSLRAIIYGVDGVDGEAR